MIKKLLKNKIPIDNNKVTFMFSGRVSINVLAKKFRKNAKVLIPDYICNVVDKAFEEAGYTIIRYKLKENFEPNIQEIIDCIEKNKIDILLFASLYGSDRFLDTVYNQNSKLCEVINSNQIEVIIDFAQDFYRINNLKLEQRNHHYIFSFNDKSFMGAMGAIIISNRDFSNIKYEKLLFKQHIFLLKSYIIKILNCKTPWLLKNYQRIRRRKIKNISKLEYEYSTCKVFPYQYNNYSVSNIQIFFALIGILQLNKYYKNQYEFLTDHREVLTMYGSKTSAYVVVNDTNKIKNKIKKPYSYYNDEFTSKYPKLKIIHNKGFCDK